MKDNNFDAQKSSLVFLCSFLIAQFVLSFWQIILKSILTAFHYHNVDNFLSNPFLYMIFTLAQTLVFVGIFVFSIKQLNLKKEIKQKPLNWKTYFAFVVMGIISIFALSYFINYFTVVLNLFGEPSTSLPYAIDSWSSYLFSIISLAILPAIGEELLFRATLFNGLKSKGKLYAVVMSSVMFMIFHFNLSQLYYPLFFGMLLGIAYATTDNIIVPITMHFLNNALNITLQFFSKSGYSSTKLYQVIIGVVIYLVVLFISLLVMSNSEDKGNHQLKKTKSSSLVAEKENKSTNKSIGNINFENIDMSVDIDDTNKSVKHSKSNNDNTNSATADINQQENNTNITNNNLPFYKTEKFLTYLPIGIMIFFYIITIFL